MSTELLKDTTAAVDAYDLDPARRDLLSRLAELGERPFQREVTPSPWDDVVDFESLHHDVKQRVLEVVRRCPENDAVRCLTVAAQPGYGKTHLLSWTRHRLEEQNTAVFVCVRPCLDDSGPIEQQVLHAALESVDRRPANYRKFCENTTAFLSRVYDDLVERRQWKTLRLRRGAFAWLPISRPNLKILPRSYDDQLYRLQPALTERAFLDEAYGRFTESFRGGGGGAEPDRDAFIAACLWACGDSTRRRQGRQWLFDEPFPQQQRDELQLDHWRKGQGKQCNTLYTLSRLAGMPFCLAFDQLENWYNVSQARRTVRRDMDQLAMVASNLALTPNVSLLFMVQLSIWQGGFQNHAAPQFIDRMTEGYGAQVLQALTQSAAGELVQTRMNHHVWKVLGAAPPEGQTYFPFRPEEIEAIRRATHGVLRDFLQQVRQRYADYLHGVDEPMGEELPVEPNPASEPTNSSPAPLCERIDPAKIREARSTAGLTQSKVAEKIGKSVSYVSALEHGRNAPADRIYQQLAELFNVPLENMLSSTTPTRPR